MLLDVSIWPFKNATVLYIPKILRLLIDSLSYFLSIIYRTLLHPFGSSAHLEAVCGPTAVVALDEAVEQGIPRDDVGGHMSLVEARNCCQIQKIIKFRVGFYPMFHLKKCLLVFATCHFNLGCSILGFNIGILY